MEQTESREVSTENVGVTVVLGSDGMYGKWGKGADVAEAKKNFRRYGGVLGWGYTILEFDSNTEFRGIDQMGYVSWATVDGSLAEAHHPEVTEVAATRKR